MDEPESHLAYDFFAPGPLPGYAGNPNNNNRWIKADMPLLVELGAEANEPMVGPIVDEIVEPIVKMKDQVGGPSTATAEGWSFTLPAPGFLIHPSVIEDLSTRTGNLEYRHGQLVKKVVQVSDVEAIGACITGCRAAERCVDSAAADYEFRKNHAMSDKSSPFKMSSFGKLFELNFSKEKSVFTPATDYCASNSTPIDCMERVLFESSKIDAIRLDQVDYASRGVETLELKLRSSSNEQRAYDAQLFS
nr:hypothetical protein [Tanacetum cinerariifolium]